VFTAKGYSATRAGRPTSKRCKPMSTWNKSSAFLRTGLKVADYADLSLVGDADKRLATAANH
jgi:hypothetical protein